MVNIPVRNLAERGIVLDMPPWDLPLNAFSGGSNVRFKDGRVNRTPVFRTLHSSSLVGEPFHVTGYRPSTGYDLIVVGNSDGRIYNATGTNMTPAGRAVVTDLRPWTSTLLGDVLYVNHPAHLPAALLPSASAFVNLANWPSTWRTRSLRAVRDFLFAFNITKGANAFPTTVAWSDATLFGQVPGSWDATNLSTLANELVLSKLDSPLVDGLPLGEHMVAYSESAVIRFEYTGDVSDAGQNLWVNRPIFATGGAIGPNCVTEVDGKHYVFGVDDLYVHDGVSRQSIGAAKVRRWVFQNMNLRFSDRNFVFHIPKTNEILFAFVSGDPDAYFQEPTRCNKGVLYDIERDVFAPIDLPNVSAATLVNVDPTLTYDTAGASRTYENTGGTYYDLRDGFVRHSVMCASPLASRGLTSSSIFAYDEMNTGQLAYPMLAAANPPAFVERVGIDLDEQGAELVTHKTIRALFPQIFVHRDLPVRFKVGSSTVSQGPYTWGDWVTFNPKVNHKVDVRKNGRYLAIRMEAPLPMDFDFSGFDVDVVPGGRR